MKAGEKELVEMVKELEALYCEIGKNNDARERELVAQVVDRVIDLLVSKNGKLPVSHNYIADLGRYHSGPGNVMVDTYSLVFVNRQLAVWHLHYNAINPTGQRSEEYIYGIGQIKAICTKEIETYDELVKWLEEIVVNLERMSKYYKSRLGKVIPKLGAALRALQ